MQGLVCVTAVFMAACLGVVSANTMPPGTTTKSPTAVCAAVVTNCSYNLAANIASAGTNKDQLCTVSSTYATCVKTKCTNTTLLPTNWNATITSALQLNGVDCSFANRLCSGPAFLIMAMMSVMMSSLK